MRTRPTTFAGTIIVFVAAGLLQTAAVVAEDPIAPYPDGTTYRGPDPGSSTDRHFGGAPIVSDRYSSAVNGQHARWSAGSSQYDRRIYSPYDRYGVQPAIRPDSLDDRYGYRTSRSGLPFLDPYQYTPGNVITAASPWAYERPYYAHAPGYYFYRRPPYYSYRWDAGWPLRGPGGLYGTPYWGGVISPYSVAPFAGAPYSGIGLAYPSHARYGAFGYTQYWQNY